MNRLIFCFVINLALFHSCVENQDHQKRVLIYTKNGEGYVHENIDASVAALEKICAAEDFLTEVSDQPEVFTAENLERFDAIVFSNTNNEGFQLNLLLVYLKDQRAGKFLHTLRCRKRLLTILHLEK